MKIAEFNLWVTLENSMLRFIGTVHAMTARVAINVAAGWVRWLLRLQLLDCTILGGAGRERERQRMEKILLCNHISYSNKKKCDIYCIAVHYEL